MISSPFFVLALSNATTWNSIRLFSVKTSKPRCQLSSKPCNNFQVTYLAASCTHSLLHLCQKKRAS